MSEFTIIGAGLAGPLLACYLGKAGHSVELYDRRSDPRTAGLYEGKSINLALSVRGLHALTEVGLADRVLQDAVLMRGRMIHPKSGPHVFQPYGKDDSESLYSVSRGGLNRFLVEAAAQLPNVKLHFDMRCNGIDVDTGDIEFGERRVASQCCIGADGARSAIRSSMQKLERFEYSQEYLSHGYKELVIPPAADGGFRMEPNALHIWPRGDFMMIALPNSDRSFTATLFWPFEGPRGFSRLTTEAEVLAYFNLEFPDAVPMIPDLGQSFLENPVGSLVTIRCRPWHVGERAVLVGDAAHAVVPFLGQGMNAAFEDCTVLAECLANHANRAAAFAEYDRRRQIHADVLADLCVENFVEMRDKVASPWFLLKKKLDILLHRLFPTTFLPLYTMIEFTRIPYADAQQRATRQELIVKSIFVAFGACAVIAAIWGWWK